MIIVMLVVRIVLIIISEISPPKPIIHRDTMETNRSIPLLASHLKIPVRTRTRLQMTVSRWTPTPRHP